MTGESRPVLEVLEPGLLSTIQDAGRPGATRFGVPRGGACDPLAHAAANLLAGNPRGAPVLELSLLGPRLKVMADGVIAIAGADFDLRLEPVGLGVAPGQATDVKAGDVLAFGGAADGARGYLAIGGGFDVPPVLGSASTSLAGRFGGLDGRPLRPGDVLKGGLGAGAVRATAWPGPGQSSGVPPSEEVEIRVLAGPDTAELGSAALDRFAAMTWEVDPRSDRMGVRLGALGSEVAVPSTTPASSVAELLSMPMTWGAIQLPPGGRPICLLVDGPTVGGYPVVATVAAVDRAVLGQLRAGHRVRFRLISQVEAADAFAAQQTDLREAARRLGAT